MWYDLIWFGLLCLQRGLWDTGTFHTVLQTLLQGLQTVGANEVSGLLYPCLYLTTLLSFSVAQKGWWILALGP